MSEVLNDLVIFGVFMFIAFFIRERIKIFQKLYFSTAMLAGILALILGSNVLGLVPSPETFSSYAGVLVRLVMSSMVFGVLVSVEKLRSVADFLCIETGAFGFQLALSVGVGMILCLFWPSLPQGWGYMALTAFYGGHGAAANAGSILQSLTGNADYTTYGAILSSFGLLIAVLVGMVIVNIGIRKGYGTYVKALDKTKDQSDVLGGVLREEKRVVLGKSIVTNLSINAITLQFIMILSGMFLGERLFAAIGRFIPFFATLSIQACDVFGCVILFYLMRAVKLDSYIDRKTVTQINGLVLDLVVFGALATLNVKVLLDNFIPLLTITIIVCAATIAFLYFTCRNLCNGEWFEKTVFFIGQMTGTNATGFALVRTLDPDSQSIVWEAQAIVAGVGLYFDLAYTLAPQFIASGNLTGTIGIGILMFAVGIGLAWIIRRKRTN